MLRVFSPPGFYCTTYSILDFHGLKAHLLLLFWPNTREMDKPVKHVIEERGAQEIRGAREWCSVFLRSEINLGEEVLEGRPWALEDSSQRSWEVRVYLLDYSVFLLDMGICELMLKKLQSSRALTVSHGSGQKSQASTVV